MTEVAPGELMVEGESIQKFKNHDLMINYKANRYGYVANYNLYIYSVGRPQPVSAACLKTCTG